jgi:hypothetical protein
MTTKSRSLKDAITQASGMFGKDIVAIMYCEVDSVDEEAKTCDCTPINNISDASLPGVQLNAESNDGLTLYPEVGSTIIVGLSKTNQAFMMLAEDLSKITIVIGDSALTITDGLFEFNGGVNAGLVLLGKLVTQMNKTENKVNDIITAFNSHVHPGVQTGAGSSGASATPITGTLTPTENSDIENTAITQ